MSSFLLDIQFPQANYLQIKIDNNWLPYFYNQYVQPMDVIRDHHFFLVSYCWIRAAHNLSSSVTAKILDYWCNGMSENSQILLEGSKLKFHLPGNHMLILPTFKYKWKD